MASYPWKVLNRMRAQEQARQEARRERLEARRAWDKAYRERHADARRAAARARTVEETAARRAQLLAQIDRARALAATGDVKAAERLPALEKRLKMSDAQRARRLAETHSDVV